MAKLPVLGVAMLSWSDWARPVPHHERDREASHFISGFRQPARCCEPARMGDEAKPSVLRIYRRLCCVWASTKQNHNFVLSVTGAAAGQAYGYIAGPPDPQRSPAIRQSRWFPIGQRLCCVRYLSCAGSILHRPARPMPQQRSTRLRMLCGTLDPHASGPRIRRHCGPADDGLRLRA
jgi:hypothetical protein